MLTVRGRYIGQRVSADAFYGCYANVNKTFVYILKRTFTKVMNSTKLFIKSL